MKNVSNGFKNAIKSNGREIDVRIQDSGGYLQLSDIFSCRLYTNGGILKTLMKKLVFETYQVLSSDTINFELGVKVNGSFEYVDYGKFVVNETSYNEDTNRYTYTCYDKMLLTMVSFNDTNSYPITLENFTYNILYDLGFTLTNQTLPNGSRTFNSNPFEGYDRMTYRDVLDCICEVVGASAIVDNTDFTFITPTQTNETISGEYLKENNIKFGDTFGPINSILFTRFEDADFIEIKDDVSIAQNGKTQIKIKDNPILNGDDRADYQSELFAVINGLSYNLNDYLSTGIVYLDFMDLYSVVHKNNTYNCLMLNDELTIKGGLSETIYTDEPQEYEKEYKTSTETTEDVSAKVDKANKEIVLKVDSNGKLVQQKLGLDANGGSVFNVKADNIKLEGYTTINGTFTIDNNGNMSCSNATITGGVINIPSTISKHMLYDGGLIMQSPSNTNYILMNVMGNYMGGYQGYLGIYDEGNVGIEAYGNGTLSCNSLACNNIKTGTITLYGNQNSYASFGVNMITAPIVILTSCHDGTSNAYVGNVVAVDQYGFQAYRSGGGATGIAFNWIAINM